MATGEGKERSRRPSPSGMEDRLAGKRVHLPGRRGVGMAFAARNALAGGVLLR